MKNLITNLFVSAIFFLLVQTAAAQETFVIVHGAFQDASVWSEVKTRLEKSGNEVIIVNLPGRKGNETAPETLTAEKYRDEIVKAIGERKNIVLVGHSFGGIQISNVAEIIPDQIKTLVYVAAYLPQAGDSLQSLSGQDKNNKFSQKNFLVAADFKTADVLSSDRELIFCNDCSAQAKKKFSDGFVIEPLAPMAEGAKVTNERFGKVKKVYVYTTLDNAVSYPLQQVMTAKTKVDKNFTLKTGHSPFLSNPKKLSKILKKAAKL